VTRLTAGPDSNDRSLCVFERAGRKLALPVWAVREVIGGETVSPVPCAPAEIAGAINLRGEPLVLVQIDDWIGARFRPCGTADHILVLECGDVQAGLLVDRVCEVCPCDRPLGDLPPLGGSHRWPGPLAPREWARAGFAVAVVDPHELAAALVEVARAALRRSPGDRDELLAGAAGAQSSR
jgi:purine-binding chemotaxis protein CheW